MSFFTMGRNRRRDTDFVDKPILSSVANITILMARTVNVLLCKAKAVTLQQFILAETAKSVFQLTMRIFLI